MHNGSYIEPNARVVYVEVSITSNYELGDGPKPAFPRLRVFGWFADKQADWGRGIDVYTGKNGWMERAIVDDFSGELPDRLFAIVRCSDRCSWWVDHVFVSEENARAHVLQEDTKPYGYLHWVVLADRCR